ncbi:hypothetical protein C8Q80DRAFT_465773 [Daedaleopsis nitida]|nr:hypothetical protein C8Q80DRAFT_465773 [Daedaleopsis nitida]
MWTHLSSAPQTCGMWCGMWSTPEVKRPCSKDASRPSIARASAFPPAPGGPYEPFPRQALPLIMPTMVITAASTRCSVLSTRMTRPEYTVVRGCGRGCRAGQGCHSRPSTIPPGFRVALPDVLSSSPLSAKPATDRLEVRRFHLRLCVWRRRLPCFLSSLPATRERRVGRATETSPTTFGVHSRPERGACSERQRSARCCCPCSKCLRHLRWSDSRLASC